MASEKRNTREGVGPAEALGLYAVLIRERRDATATVLGPRVAVCIAAGDLCRFLSDNREIVVGMFKHFVKKLGKGFLGMIRGRDLVVVATLVALALAVRGAGDDPELAKAAVPRFRQVAPGLYRGGQPSPAGFEFLKWRGIKTVINLREEHDEREAVEKLGMKYFYFPMNARDSVSEATIDQFFSVLKNPQNQPVFVHCRRGADRTGFMMGLYRIAQQGWDGRAAYQEARALGMRWWYLGLKKQLYEYAARPR